MRRAPPGFRGRERSADRYPASAAGVTVFAFDRDHTVDVNPPPGEDRPAVPLEWVRQLAHETAHVVYATGNQRLREEADVPGIPAILDRHPDPERVTGEPAPWGYDNPARPDRLRLLAEVYPDADRYVVVDDVDLSEVEGWEHFTAWEFVPSARAGEFRFDPD